MVGIYITESERSIIKKCLKKKFEGCASLGACRASIVKNSHKLRGCITEYILGCNSPQESESRMLELLRNEKQIITTVSFNPSYYRDYYLSQGYEIIKQE